MAESELLALVAAADVAVTSYPHGGVIFVKDDAPGHAYVVKSGRVEIREAGRVLERIEPGEIFGEVGMIDRGPRSASAVAVGSTDLYVVDRATFDRLVRRRNYARHGPAAPRHQCAASAAELVADRQFTVEKRLIQRALSARYSRATTCR